MGRIFIRLFISVILLGTAACSSSGSFSLQVRFPDSQATGLVSKLSIFVLEPGASGCAQLRSGELGADDLPLRGRLEVVPPFSESAILAAVPAVERAFFGEENRKPTEVDGGSHAFAPAQDVRVVGRLTQQQVRAVLTHTLLTLTNLDLASRNPPPLGLATAQPATSAVVAIGLCRFSHKPQPRSVASNISSASRLVVIPS